MKSSTRFLISRTIRKMVNNMKISTCSINEIGKAIGGKAGDQTGKEYYIRDYYDGPWDYVLRYPDKKITKQIADLAEKIAKDNKCGYDQAARLGLYNQLKNHNFDYDKITDKFNADCSSSTSAIIITIGNLNNIKELEDLNPSSTTRNLKNNLTNAGFKIVKTTKLKPGDVLLREGHHVVITIDDEVKESTEYEVGKTYKITVSTLNVRKGPGTKNDIVTTLKKDSKVKVIKTKKIGSSIWLKVTKGWICGITSGGDCYVR